MATRSAPKLLPLQRRMVNISSIPCVGCECRPSPALSTLICGATWLAIKCAVPESAWRTINISHCMACKLCRVSSNDSPLLVAEVLILIFNTSADKRLAASSNVVRVRVLASKNKLTMVLPRNSGTFLTDSLTPAKLSAVSRIWLSMVLPKPSIVRKCFSLPFLSSWIFHRS